MSDFQIINGYALSTTFSDGVGRIRDIELAERLGYPRPRKIRDLVRKLKFEGILNDSEVIALRVQPSRKGGRPASENWFSELSALIVAARSEAKNATAILREVIDVFIACRRSSARGKSSATMAP